MEADLYMPSCFQEAVSLLWIGLNGKFRLTYEDKAIEAEDQLSRLILQLERREDILRASAKKLAGEAVSCRSDKTKCKIKIMEHKRTQAQLDRLLSYKDTVMQHIDALKNTELNKTLISALQESTKTLKTMGIKEGLKNAEEVATDVEQSMQQAQELTSVLGLNMQSTTISDDDFEEELELLLGVPVPVVNQMEEITPPARVLAYS
jgi:uncharacterized protein YicC (UPF0701 family)